MSELDDGYNTVLGENGSKLSGGQKQRLCIAREISKGRNIMIFDEPTSAVDAISNRRINEAILNLRGETTVLVITHNRSTAMTGDEVLVLKDGSIIEKGLPKTLAAREKSYFNRYLS